MNLLPQRFIDFASATPEELDQLTVACEPATFGHGTEDVYDETYRKARRVDSQNFSTQLDPVGSGLLQTIETQLAPTQAKKPMSIKAEIYKLNVYGGFDSLMTDDWDPSDYEHHYR